MPELKVYNSYSRKKEVFTPITPGYVGLYVCGPTVSGESHLGHARPFITFDFILRYLTHLGYKVRYVRNITDAGHFEEEGREAEDKISKKAVIEKLEPMELVQKYTNLFHWAMHNFNNLEPRAKAMVSALNALKIGTEKILLIIPDNAPETKATLYRAAGNLENVKPLLVNYLNLDDMLKYDRVVMPLQALDWINDKLGADAREASLAFESGSQEQIAQ